MKCTWDNNCAVAEWTTRRHNRFRLCFTCFMDWVTRANLTPETRAVLGYLRLVRLADVQEITEQEHRALAEAERRSR